MHEHLYDKEAVVKTGEQLADDFQTPAVVCDYCVSLLSFGVKTVFEPTPGKGNMVLALARKLKTVVIPDHGDYFRHIKPTIKYDAVAMNPPFSSKFLTGQIPEDWKDVGMKAGYRMLFECMELTDEVVAIVPWFLITDSDARVRHLKDYGLVSVTHLPRKTFNYARIQCVVLHLKRGYDGNTDFRMLTL